jgi:Uma2 family endonuclease
MLPPNMNDSLLEPLLQSPSLPEHLAHLNRLLAEEQQRRRKFYEEITEDHKWEFINGQVIMHSPAAERHNHAITLLSRLLSSWCDAQKLGRVYIEKALCQFPRNDYEPDIVFFGSAKAALIQPETLLHPIPDFVVEVLSPTTEKFDRGIKLDDYQAHGVKEYWVVNAESRTVEQFVLSGSRFAREAYDLRQRIRSTAVAGFEIPVRAIFDEETNVAELRRLLEASR